MNFIGYHRDCGGRVRQIITKKLYASNECNRCNSRNIYLIDILTENPMPKIVHQKSSGVQIKRKYYDNMETK